jgi:hypothetical protein
MPRQGTDKDHFAEVVLHLRSLNTPNEVDVLMNNFNLSRSRVQSLLSELGLSKKQLDHSDTIPRGIRADHKRILKEHQYLLYLSYLLKTGKAMNTYSRMVPAFSWATSHWNSERREAVKYDPKRGFYYVPSTPEWHNLQTLVEGTAWYFGMDKEQLDTKLDEAAALIEETEEQLTDIRKEGRRQRSA